MKGTKVYLRFSEENLQVVARAIDQQLTIMMLGVLCFFLSILTSTGYTIYSSVFLTKTYTVRYVFFALSAGSMLFTVVAILVWNRRLRSLKPSTSLV